jgi:Glycosyl hydrolases family 39
VNVTVTAPAPPPTGSALPTDFFDISYSTLQASHFPSVPFGGIRAWDTNTSWAQIEASQGNYNWTMLDQWLSAAASHGKDVMYTFGFVPTWASSDPGAACFYMVADPGCTAPPADVDSGDNMWKTFVTAIVNHSLSSPELHIAYYELWNEPDLTRNWSGTPAQLVTMAADAYAIVHRLDPNAKVVGPSPSTANQWGVHFLPAYYAAGGATAQDIVGMHAYLYDGSTFSTSPAGIITSITQLKLLMSTYGISSKPIWFTEGNWGSTNTSVMTDAQKAAYVAQEYLLMWSTGAVSRYYWYAWDNTLWGTLWNATTGVRPAGVAYGRVADWLIGSVHPDSPCAQSTDATWTCSLTLSSGYPAQIVWNASLSKTITVSAEFATYETISNSTVNTIEANQVSIGNAPILLIGSQVVQ